MYLDLFDNLHVLCQLTSLVGRRYRLDARIHRARLAHGTWSRVCH